ncbi:MAG: ABC transporter ATP-binding protein [Desulfobacteraceae bacterium]|nr:ABC transporter ATP-binding protein [Desulfobacteraceae bacterium]
MIELFQLTKKYTHTVAVADLNLIIPEGELFGFIGPNGAGKTTTIKMMGGLLSPTNGRIRICGIDMIDQPVKAKQCIGFIPDRPYLYEKLTGMEFMQFTADLYRIDHNRFREQANRGLELFSLSEWGDELIESYSHGMKQRLIMAAALLHDPRVIIVDEPMVGLDPAAIVLVKNLFRRLAAAGTTIFMSTHTLAVAEDICDRIGVIHKGKVIAIGTPDELKQMACIDNAGLEQVFLRLIEK